MSEDMISVQDTGYDEYFEKTGENTVFLLSEEVAEKAWDSEVYANCSSYFSLPGDCWVVSRKTSPIGNWMDAYNNDDNEAVERLLRGAVDWRDEAVIRFFAKREIVFQTKWSDFLRYWDAFLAIEDDCPIIIPESCIAREALVFRPVGDILKIG